MKTIEKILKRIELILLLIGIVASTQLLLLVGFLIVIRETII